MPDRPLRSRSRAFPLLAAAAATAVVLIGAIALGQYLRRDQGGVATSPTPTESPSASATPSATSSPSTTPTPTATASPSPTGTPIALPAPAQLSAASRDVVWALVAGDNLFRSTDQGATWERRFFPTGAVANAEIAFISDREGWISSVSVPATQCQSQKVTLWHTADGAATWQQLQTSGIADAQCKSQLSFIDASHGFIVASVPAQKAVIYRTADGGRTWSASRQLPDPPGITTTPGQPNLQPGRVRGFGASLLVPVAGPSQGANSADYVYRSTDGGATWVYAATAPELGVATLVALTTETRWLQPVIPGAWRETTDGGRTWHSFATDYQQAAPIAPEVIFADASIGYATIPTRGSIQRTVDGGAHWTAIKTPGTS